MACAVNGCKNLKRLKPKGVTFYRFPTGSLLNEWLRVLDKGSKWQWTNKLICSEHFSQNDIIKTGVKTKLVSNAVPTLKLLSQASGSCTDQPSISSQSSTEVTRKPVKQKFKRPLGISTSGSSTDSSGRKKVKFIDVQHSTLPRKQFPNKVLTIDIPSVSYDNKNFEFSSEKTSLVKTYRSSPQKVRESLRTLASRSSSDSSGKRRRTTKFLHSLHNYNISPSKVKKQLINLKKVHTKSRRELYTAKKTIKLLRIKVTTLKTIIDDLKKNCCLSDTAIYHLQKCYEDVPHLLMRRYVTNWQHKSVSRGKYPEVLRKFACTLQFYSNKAYEYVRKTFALALPHQSVIRKWSSNINCHPGFIQPSFNALKIKVEEAKLSNHPIVCSLLLDEMAIKKKIEFDGQKIWGYVDIGVNVESDDLEPASEALVLMVVCHNSHWKLPIAYFLIKSLSGAERANIVKESLIRLDDIGIIVTSITCDGPSVHFTMLKELGCQLDEVNNMNTWFFHPTKPTTKIFCILDVCHMLKLMRNLLGTLEQIRTPDGIVNWQFIKNLYSIQEDQVFHFANKLKKSHIQWEKQKMKVDLAAQTLSSSVAVALEFLDSDLHHPLFRNVGATSSFLKRMDKLFDLLNSKTPWAKGCKAPLRKENEDVWRPFLLETCSFLLQCTDINERPLYCTHRKTTILGFVISTLSIVGIFDTYVKTNVLNYLLTYKCSQDHLEIFFSSVRARNGWNNNPSSLQFMRTFRKLLLFSKLSDRDGNCRVLDDTIVLTVPSTTTSKDTRNIDISVCRQYDLEIPDQLLDHDYNIISHDIAIGLSDLSLNVITYIGGYVIKMLRKTLKCIECLECCTSGSDEVAMKLSYRFTLKKNTGGLLIPSEAVVKICQVTETYIRKVMALTGNRIPSEDNLFPSLTIIISQKFYATSDQLFPTLVDHCLSFPSNEEKHTFILIKQIVNAYLRIRIFSLAKKYTDRLQGPSVRQALNKLILFNHQ